MSFLKKVAHGIAGFATGGPMGALSAFAGPGNPAKTKNRGRQPQVNVTRGKVQLNPDLSPVPMSGVPMSAPGGISSPISTPTSTNNWSASGLVRNAASSVVNTGGAYGAMPVLSPGGGSFGGSGGSMSWGAGQSPVWLYRHFYTKKGTPRRLKADGTPYAIPRMNPMNPRAARRAIRRIRGARKLLQRIERSLPKATHRRSSASSRSRPVEFIRQG